MSGDILSGNINPEVPPVAHMHLCVRRLQRLVPVITVTMLALRQQAAELDEEFAEVLSGNVIDPMTAELERLDTLLARFAAERLTAVGSGGFVAEGQNRAQ